MSADVQTPICVVPGYRVEAASNGGWVVYETPYDRGLVARSAAFTTWIEMLDYLDRAHATPIPATAA